MDIIIGITITAEGRTWKFEFYSFNQTVFRSLCDFKCTSAKSIIERNCRSFTANDCYCLATLRFIFIRHTLGHGVCARFQIRDTDFSVTFCNNGFINTVFWNTKWYTTHFAIFCCFYNLASAGDFFVYCIDGYKSIVCATDCHIPLRLTVSTIVCWENSFLNEIISILYIFNKCISGRRGGADKVVGNLYAREQDKKDAEELKKQQQKEQGYRWIVKIKPHAFFYHFNFPIGSNIIFFA